MSHCITIEIRGEDLICTILKNGDIIKNGTIINSDVNALAECLLELARSHAKSSGDWLAMRKGWA